MVFEDSLWLHPLGSCHRLLSLIGRVFRNDVSEFCADDFGSFIDDVDQLFKGRFNSSEFRGAVPS